MKKHTFKIAITLLLTAICILSLFSCKKEPTTVPTDPPTGSESTVEVPLGTSTQPACFYGHSISDGVCTGCGLNVHEFEFKLSDDGSCYTLTKLKYSLTSKIEVPAYYQGKPVKAIGDGAFKSLHIGRVDLPEGIVSIGDEAFYECFMMPSISLPDSLESIGKNAFKLCNNLDELTIPKSLKSIGEGAFDGCRIEKVEVKSFGAWCAIDFEDLKSNPMYKGALLTMDGEPISKIVFGETDKEIKRFTFAGCKNLLSVVFSESLTSIGEGAFYGCTALDQISIPKNIKSIGKSAFEGCVNISEIAFDGTLAEWNKIEKDEKWNDGTSNCTLKCNDATEIISRFSLGLEYGSARGVQNALMVTGIGTCTDTEIYIPAMHDGKPVVHIGDECFKGQKQITKIVIPDSVTEIYPNAFSECENLKEVVLGSGADYIESLFVGCTSLEKVTIPDGVRFISVSCFRGCTALKSITLPATVSEFHINAFSGCSSLTDIFFKGTKAQFNDILKDRTWMVGTPLQTVHCSDGDLNYVE